MRWLLVVAVLLVARLEAADFRTSDFGDPCALIANREAALGGEPIPWRRADPNIHAFKGRVFGREVSIVYLCSNGVLRSGSYFFSKQTREGALESLRVAYDGLISVYGAPFLDSSPWQYGEDPVDPRLVATDPRKYWASWRTPRISSAAALMLSGDELGPNWEVMVVFSKNCLTKRPADARVLAR